MDGCAPLPVILLKALTLFPLIITAVWKNRAVTGL
jgi:hypothetical protein